jgi:hypothetical protein
MAPVGEIGGAIRAWFPLDAMQRRRGVAADEEKGVDHERLCVCTSLCSTYTRIADWAFSTV